MRQMEKRSRRVAWDVRRVAARDEETTVLPEETRAKPTRRRSTGVLGRDVRAADALTGTGRREDGGRV